MMQHDETTNEELTSIVARARLLRALDIYQIKTDIFIQLNQIKAFSLQERKTKKHCLKIVPKGL